MIVYILKEHFKKEFEEKICVAYEVEITKFLRFSIIIFEDENLISLKFPFLFIVVVLKLSLA